MQILMTRPFKGFVPEIGMLSGASITHKVVCFCWAATVTSRYETIGINLLGPMDFELDELLEM